MFIWVVYDIICRGNEEESAASEFCTHTKNPSRRGRGICPERDLVDLLVVRREAIFKVLEWPRTHGVGARQCAVGIRTKNASVRALPLGVGPTPYSDGTITSSPSRHASPGLSIIDEELPLHSSGGLVYALVGHPPATCIPQCFLFTHKRIRTGCPPSTPCPPISQTLSVHRWRPSIQSRTSMSFSA